MFLLSYLKFFIAFRNGLKSSEFVFADAFLLSQRKGFQKHGFGFLYFAEKALICRSRRKRLMEKQPITIAKPNKGICAVLAKVFRAE